MALDTFSDEDVANLVLVLAVVVIAVLAIGRVAFWQKFKDLRARGWPTVQGRVEMVSVEERRFRHVRYYAARLDYSYSANNEYYSGYRERIFMRESSAERFAAAMKDQIVFVRHDPAKHERSTLLKDDQPAWPA